MRFVQHYIDQCFSNFESKSTDGICNEDDVIDEGELRCLAGLPTKGSRSRQLGTCSSGECEYEFPFAKGKFTIEF